MIRPDWYSNPPAVVGPDPKGLAATWEGNRKLIEANKQTHELARELKAQAERREGERT